jgi:outer membrane protein, adhesin transport system
MKRTIKRFSGKTILGAIALSLAVAGCSHRKVPAFDPPAPPPMDAEADMAPVVVGTPSAPVPAVVRTPPATTAPSNEQDLRAFLASWRDAWAARDVATYLKHYHPDFHGPASSAAEWRSARQRVISRAGQIELQLGVPEIRREGDNRAWLTFEQRYKAQGHNDSGIKQLQLRRIDGKWLIEQETFTPAKR